MFNIGSVFLTVPAVWVQRKCVFALAFGQSPKGKVAERAEKRGERKCALCISKAKANKAHQSSEIPIRGCFRTP